MPEECKKEISQHVIAVPTDSHGARRIITCTYFSTLGKLLQVTAYVMRFCRLLKVKAYQSHCKHQRYKLWVKEA